MSVAEASKDISEYKPKWQERFAFFDAHGAPNAPGYKPALKQLPFRKKVLVNFNFISLFFGPIYLFVLGLWKKNLVLIVGMFSVSFLVGYFFGMAGREVPRALEIGLNVAFNLTYGLMANYAYYLKERKGEQGWNPFKGMRW
ncbi:DUF2628 domain-containing protein [Pseudomonas monteilii]